MYRGELSEASDTGMSWTTYRDIARHFAQQYSSVGQTCILRARASPRAVLARFNLEDEIVVQPDLLTDISSSVAFEHFVLPRLV